MKKSMIGKVIAIICVLAIVIAGALLVKPTTATVSCSDCAGYGYTHALPCADCDGNGTVDAEDCGTCEGSGTTAVTALADNDALKESKVVCESCSGEGTVAACTGAGCRSTAGDRGCHPLCQPLEGGRCHHYRPGRRFHGGPVGLQR